MHCRISFNGVTKITKKMNKLEQTQKEILASVNELKSKPSDQNGMSQKEVEVLVREEFEEQKRIEERKLNVMCFGLEESSSMNIESRKKEDESTVKGIIEEVLGTDEEFNLTKLVRIGRPVSNAEEIESETSDSLDMNASQVKRRKIRPFRLTFDNAESKKKVLNSLRETVNEASSGKYKYIFFSTGLNVETKRNCESKESSKGSK